MKSFRTLRYVLIGLIVLILIALAGWYFLLRSEQGSLSTFDAARGAGLSPEPFGGRVSSTFENVLSSLGATPEVSGEGGKPPRLWHILRTPVSGAGFVTTGTSTVLWLLERSTGNVLQASVETGALTRITSTLVPRVLEADIAGDGTIIVRNIEGDGRIATSAAVASTTPEGSVLLRTALPADIKTFAVSPGGDEIFYLVDGPQGAVGTRAMWDGSSTGGGSASGGRQVFSSAISGWQIRWGANDRIMLVQNASDGLAGYAFLIESNGTVVPLLKNILGLTMLPHPTSRALLYGSSSGLPAQAGGLLLYARVNDTATPVLLPVRTVADKCVWAPGTALVAYCAVPQTAPPSNFLDSWYRGEAHTRDAWWRIDASAGNAELLYAPGNEIFDVENPKVDEGGNYIAFTNAIDKSAWLLRIQE